MALEGPSSGLLSMSLHGPPSGVLCKVAGSGLLSMSLQGTASGLLCKGAVRLLSIPLQGTASELFCKGAVLSMPLQLPAVLSIALQGPASGLVQPRGHPRHCWKNCCQGSPRHSPSTSSSSLQHHHCWNDRCQGSPRLRPQAFRRPQSATFHSMAHTPQAYLRSQVPFRMQGTGPTSNSSTWLTAGHGAQETSLSRTGCERVRLFLKCGDENADGDNSGNGGAGAAGLKSKSGPARSLQ